MAYVGYSDVANQANTTDGFADGVVAKNVTSAGFGEYVGADGVVDLYGNAPPLVQDYMGLEAGDSFLMETSGQIQLEVG